ncbi:Ku protein [Nordella sp. HKS 07]|uniref:non-homologous end joining protein Ku n=1 Tax=Nordella sp. HKS 07 TaxID=2712222 RepID=UPI0013E0F829|nr:Ku protein [Nordella sp. HKS 07]QIG46988.1 Ku protein [Nordella sp. HKS 07]
MAPTGRPYWKGFIKLSLVQIAVQIYSAVEPSSSGLNQIHKPSGKRVNYVKTVAGEPVDEADIVKGYEVSEGNYVVLEPEELDAVRLESKKTLDLVEFVSVDDIDPRYFEAPYYLVPEDEFQIEGYRVIQAALGRKRKLGLGQITMSGREYLVAVGALEQGLAMYILRYANEIRAADKYFGEIPDAKVNPELVDLAAKLIAENTRPFDAGQFRNTYEVRLHELVQQKSKGKKLIVKSDEERPKGANVVDLMEALKKSVKGDKSAGKTPPAKKGGKKK